MARQKDFQFPKAAYLGMVLGQVRGRGVLNDHRGAPEFRSEGELETS